MIVPEISVIVPVYNAELYLERCVNSILGQSFLDFELILMDDGSTDNSPAICDAMGEKDPRIRVIHKQNTGVSDTRNRAIQFACGKYVAFVDADDYIAEKMLELMYQELHNHSCDLVMCNYYVDSGDKLTPAKMKYEQSYDTKMDVKNRLLKRYYETDQVGLYSLCNKLFRRSLIVNHQIEMNVELAIAEDAWFVFDYLKVCSSVRYVSVPLYYYYQNPNSAMHRVRLDQYEKWVYTRKRLLAENENLQFKLDYQKFYSEFCYKVCIYLRSLIKIGEKTRAREIMKDGFFSDAMKHTTAVAYPAHIKVILWLLEYKLYGLCEWIYYIWR